MGQARGLSLSPDVAAKPVLAPVVVYCQSVEPCHNKQAASGRPDAGQQAYSLPLEVSTQVYFRRASCLLGGFWCS